MDNSCEEPTLRFPRIEKIVEAQIAHPTVRACFSSNQSADGSTNIHQEDILLEKLFTDPEDREEFQWLSRQIVENCFLTTQITDKKIEKFIIQQFKTMMRDKATINQILLKEDIPEQYKAFFASETHKNKKENLEKWFTRLAHGGQVITQESMRKYCTEKKETQEGESSFELVRELSTRKRVRSLALDLSSALDFRSSVIDLIPSGDEVNLTAFEAEFAKLLSQKSDVLCKQVSGRSYRALVNKMAPKLGISLEMLIQSEEDMWVQTFAYVFEEMCMDEIEIAILAAGATWPLWGESCGIFKERLENLGWQDEELEFLSIFSEDDPGITKRAWDLVQYSIDTLDKDYVRRRVLELMEAELMFWLTCDVEQNPEWHQYE